MTDYEYREFLQRRPDDELFRLFIDQIADRGDPKQLSSFDVVFAAIDRAGMIWNFDHAHDTLTELRDGKEIKHKVFVKIARVNIKGPPFTIWESEKFNTNTVHTETRPLIIAALLLKEKLIQLSNSGFPKEGYSNKIEKQYKNGYLE